MTLLLIVSVIWAFSFGLIKGLSGLDPTAIAALRLVISLLVFAPFLRPRPLGAARMARLAVIGAVQFGAVYILYLRAYAHLHAYEVALYTITTPLFVALLDALLERRWRMRYAAAAALSVAGAGVVLWRSVGDAGILGGFVLVQLSNLCFAAGQLAWRRERARLPAGSGDASVFALLFAGALALTLAVSLAATHWGAFSPGPAQWATIAYLGAVASGAGFFLWNVGATRVNAGALAAFNNAKIPLGIACSILVFGERADLARLAGGGALMALGVWVAGAGREGSVS
jgi:drug/metabolite transporter (DMT)-like permease